jgi:transketolase
VTRATDPAQLTIDACRKIAVYAVHNAAAGHPGTALALARVA